MVFVVACTHNCSWDLVIKLLFVSFFAISNKEPAIPYEQQILISGSEDADMQESDT